MRFKYPLLFDQIYIRFNKSFLQMYRKENYNKDPKPYIETYNENGFRLAKIEPLKDISIDWRLFTLPPDSNTKVSKIVISQGLEIDNLRFSMQFPVVEQKVRLQAPANDNSKFQTEK